jgi:hypothetical protein
MVDLKELDLPIASNIAVFVFSFLAPGFLVVFLIKPELFIGLDFWKLLVLSLALTTPTFVFPLLVAASIYLTVLKSHPEEADGWGGPREWYLRLGFNNSCSIFVICLIVWSFGLGVRGFVTCGAIATAMHIVGEFFLFWRFLRDPSGFTHGWGAAIARMMKG